HNRLALEATLASLGEELVSVSSGREALRLLLQRDFAVILLDVMMEGMDGFETASLIHQNERTREMPIIFLTAARHGEVPLDRGYQTGAVDFIFKPVDPLVLRGKVRVFAELARSRKLQADQARELRQANENL